MVRNHVRALYLYGPTERHRHLYIPMPNPTTGHPSDAFTVGTCSAVHPSIPRIDSLRNMGR